MEFASANPSVVRSVKQRDLLNGWLRALGKDVSYERLLLPFGRADKVEQIVGSFKAISIEGGFKVTNLMGIQSRITPVIRAVIDLEFVPVAADHHASDDVIEWS